MALARFLQVSDLHLGRPFGWLLPERREERRRDQRAALERVVQEAIERGVHAILVPGDLFDQEGVDADTLSFALQAFRVTGCPPVFVSPGNHDPWWEGSPYWSPRLVQARGMEWPEHLHVFRSADWSAVPLPSLKGVRIWGRCFTGNVASLERPLATAELQKLSGVDPKGFDVAVFHGSHEGKCPPFQKITAPFSEEEALRVPFAYLAAGHYHAASRVVASEGSSAGVRLAYAGSAVGLDATEVGAHGALEVRIEYSHRLPFVETEFVELDRRHVFELSVDATGAGSAEKLDRRIHKALDDVNVTENDLVTVRLSGRLARGVRYTGPPPELSARAFFLRLDLRGVRPDYDIEGLRSQEPGSTEERFAKALIEQLDREEDPLQRSVIEGALYYGLDAFRLGEVLPVYEEIGE